MDRFPFFKHRETNCSFHLSYIKLKEARYLMIRMAEVMADGE